jgi:Tfp pilus assembly protein PilO
VTERLSSLSTKAQVALVVAGLLLVAVIGYFAVISPKRSTAADLKKQAAAVQEQIARNQSAAFAQALPAVRAANVFRLAKAMPSRLETPEVILQLNHLAVASGITFDEITPSSSAASTTTSVLPTTVSADPFAVEPIEVKFSGSYYSLLVFLQRLRNLVRVENGQLTAAGRLFDVSDISFAEGAKHFPQVQATLTVNAFVPQKPQSLSTTPGSTDTTSTTTTGTTTTTSNGTSASPSTSGGTS